MKYSAENVKLLNTKKFIENIVICCLCPIWIPLFLISSISYYVSIFLEDVIFDGSENLVSVFSGWLAKKYLSWRK